MRDLFQVVFELKQKEIDDAYKKMDKDKRVKINLYLHEFSCQNALDFESA